MKVLLIYYIFQLSCSWSLWASNNIVQGDKPRSVATRAKPVHISQYDTRMFLHHYRLSSPVVENCSLTKLWQPTPITISFIWTSPSVCYKQLVLPTTEIWFFTQNFKQTIFESCTIYIFWLINIIVYIQHYNNMKLIKLCVWPISCMI